MFEKTMTALTGVTVGVTSAFVGNPAHAAATTAAAVTTADDVGILATCTGTTTRPARTVANAHIRLPSTSTDSGNYDCILREGNTGFGVFWLERALDRCHGKDLGPGGGLDERYDAFTREAVRQIQEGTGIPQDGIYGPQTKTKVHWPIFRNGDLSFTGRCEPVA